MKKLNQLLLAAGVAVLLGAGASSVSAQGRGNFDPEQFRKQMMDRYKEQLEVTNDDEWKVISERIEAVQTAQRDARTSFGGFGGFGGPGGGGRRGGGAGGAAFQHIGILSLEFHVDKLSRPLL